MEEFMHLFWICLSGQRLMNFSEQMYCHALDWLFLDGFLFSKSRVLYQFLFMNALKSSELAMIKLTLLNMEAFHSLKGLYRVWGIDYDVVIESMPPIISIFLGISMYFNGIININKTKDVLLFIKNDCNYYANRAENMILRYYEIQGRKITMCYVFYVYVTLLVYLLLPTIPLATDFLATSNYSQKKSFLYELDYGVDNEQYFYYVSLHSYIGTAIVANLIASGDVTYMLYAQHAYALFAIVSYRLKTVHIMDSSSLINLKDDDYSVEKFGNIELLPREQQEICKKLYDCIREHQNAIKYTNLLESLFTQSILVQLLFNVICLSITGVETVMKVGNVRDMMRFGSFTFALIAHIFFLCLPGQRLVNHSEQVYTAACEVMWYILPKRCHSLYKFLLARCLVTSQLTALKMAPMTMETFLAITQTAMSYFTVLLSTT